MNVTVADISEDRTQPSRACRSRSLLFLLVMAILMIPCSKLTDRWAARDASSGA